MCLELQSDNKMFKQTILVQSLHTVFLKEKFVMEFNVVVLYFFKIGWKE